MAKTESSRIVSNASGEKRSFKREPGFYWVRQGQDWIVAEWWYPPRRKRGHWYTIADPFGQRDCDFDEIREQRIVRPK